MGLTSMRYIAFSYGSHLTERDNGKFRDIIQSKKFQELWGDKFKTTGAGVVKVSNDKTGWKFASSVGGVGTGERADRVLCLPHYVPILTNLGWINIGTIVEQKLDVYIAGRNDATGRVEWQAIEKYERNPGREIVRVSWGDGFLDCTPEHPVFVQGRGYVAANEVRKGDVLVWTRRSFDLPQLPSGNSAQAKRSSQVLQQDVQVCASEGASAQGKQPSVPSVWDDGLQAACSLETAQGSFLQSSMSREGVNRRRQSNVGRRTKSISVRGVWKRLRATSQTQHVLFSEVRCRCAIRDDRTISANDTVPTMRASVQADERSSQILLEGVQERGARQTNGWERQRPLGSRESSAKVSAWVDKNAQSANQGARRKPLSEVRSGTGDGPQSGCASHRLQQGEFRSEQSDNVVPLLSWHNAREQEVSRSTETRVVESVEVAGREDVVYNIRVTPHHNYFANGILVHNCDDPHNLADGESDVIRTKTVRWFDEAMSNRLNDLKKSTIVVIMQRVNEFDVSGHIIENEDDYVHLVIPMEFDGRVCQTQLGYDDDGDPIIWTDPREEIGELAWPERYGESTLVRFRRNPFMWAGQYQQTPEPRGGGLFKRDWWQEYFLPVGASPPPFDHIVASLDSAYTKNERNDPSGMTVWGAYSDNYGNPKLMLLDAWRKHLEIHAADVVRERGESEQDYKARCQREWGLVEWVAYTCKRHNVDMLLIEAKASGLSIAQEMQRLYSNQGWGVELMDPEGDKYMRAVAHVHLFADGVVTVPVSHEFPERKDSALVPRKFAELVITESALFPNGRYKDLTDSMTQAMKYLRRNNFAVRREEAGALRAFQSQHAPAKLDPLYGD